MKVTRLQLKSHINSHSGGLFDTPFLLIDRSSGQWLNREILELNDIINQMGLTDSHTTFHSNTKDYTSSSTIFITFSRIDHILR